jgi:hypothetical protein
VLGSSRGSTTTVRALGSVDDAAGRRPRPSTPGRWSALRLGIPRKTRKQIAAALDDGRRVLASLTLIAHGPQGTVTARGAQVLLCRRRTTRRGTIVGTGARVPRASLDLASRNSIHRMFPVSVFGSSSTNSSLRG